MAKSIRKINRRSFMGMATISAAGISFIPLSLFPESSGSVRLEAVSQNGLIPGSGKDIVSSEKWWEKEPLRIIEFEQGYESGEKFGLLKDLGANMEHVTRFTDTSPGTSFLDDHSLFDGMKVNFGSLSDYLKEAHKRNIKVVIYYNVHAIEIGYARQHPGWQQIKDNGKPIEDVYSVDSSFCINSPWRNEVFQTIRRIAGFDIDGIFYDGPIFFASTCYCESCRKLFREKYSKEMPSKTLLSSSHENPGWKELVEFQSDSIALFLRESNKILKDINPGIMLYMNGNTLAPSWPTGRNNRKIIRETDILGAEGGFLYGEMKEPVYKPGAMARLLETQAEGKPTVVFDAVKQGPWAYSTLPAGEISILFNQTITNQANVWLAIGAISNLHDRETETIKKYNSLIKENPDAFFRTKSLAKTALVWPQNSGNYYSGSSVPLTDFTKEIKPEKAGNTENEFYGFYEGLSRCHCPFDVLDEEALNKDLTGYDVLVLPNATCLSKEQTGSIRTFVRNGGNIISTFETSHYSETGEKYPLPELSDVFGIEKSGDLFGPLRWDYVSPAVTNHFSVNDIKNQFINATTFGLKTQSKAVTPVYFCNPLPGSYSGKPVRSEFPFMIQNNFGRGRSIYLAGTFGETIYKYHFPEYYRILFNLLNEFSKPSLVLANAPSSVELTLRQKGNTVYAYLINYTSEMKRPIQRIVPCRDIRIDISLGRKIKSVRSIYTGTNFTLTSGREITSLILPVIEDYEVLEINLI